MRPFLGNGDIQLFIEREIRPVFRDAFCHTQALSLPGNLTSTVILFIRMKIDHLALIPSEPVRDVSVVGTVDTLKSPASQIL